MSVPLAIECDAKERENPLCARYKGLLTAYHVVVLSLPRVLQDYYASADQQHTLHSSNSVGAVLLLVTSKKILAMAQMLEPKLISVSLTSLLTPALVLLHPLEAPPALRRIRVSTHWLHRPRLPVLAIVPRDNPIPVSE